MHKVSGNTTAAPPIRWARPVRQFGPGVDAAMRRGHWVEAGQLFNLNPRRFMTNPAETPLPPGTPPRTAEDRTVAILAYVTIIGFIIAIVMHGSKKTALGSFHLRQVLGLIVTGLALWLPGIII